MDLNLFVDTRRAARALALLNPRLGYHRASIRGADRIPAVGGAMIVSNHGRLDFDSFILARLILRERKRLARPLVDHMWSRVCVANRLLARAGAVDGTRENAVHLLSSGQPVLVYPGGVREIMSGRFGHEHVDWTGRRGFAQAAIDASVPIIPIAGVGVNNGFVFVSSGRFLGRLLFRWILRLGPKYDRYRNPLAVGLLPIPLPLSVAVALPWPCRLTYYVGKPLYPPLSGASTEDQIADFALQAERALQSLIDAYGRPGDRHSNGSRASG